LLFTSIFLYLELLYLAPFIKTTPNSRCRGLLYCMDYLEDNLEEWLGEELAAFGEDDYLLFDCPGQIELYSHLTVFRTFVSYLRREGWQIAAVYCLDSQFSAEPPKFIAGCLSALSAMVQLELPHINILTKMDLREDKEEVEEKAAFPDAIGLLHALNERTHPRMKSLNASVARLLDDFGMVAFTPLDPTDEESVEACLYQVDQALQFGEDQEVRTRDFDEAEEGGGDSDLDF
jgi:GPN-loop GTPase